MSFALSVITQTATLTSYIAGLSIEDTDPKFLILIPPTVTKSISYF